MPAGRHRLERERSLPSLPKVGAAVVTAPAMTVGVVALGVSANEGAAAAAPAVDDVATHVAAPVAIPAPRTAPLTRSTDRLKSAAREGRIARNVSTRYATGDLNIRQTPAKDASVLSEISIGTKVAFTGRTLGDYAEIRWQGAFRWVTASYLAEKRPTDPAALPLSFKPCPDMSVEHGLTDRAVRVYRAVCNAFPDIRSYGGWDNHGEHSSGRAIDIMHPSVSEGYRIAEFLKAHASELELFDVIWRQHIWTPVRAGEGWRSMPDRGSATANHYDHVHVSVN